MMPNQVLVVQQPSQRDQGRKAQLRNIQAGKTVADVVRTTLGPKAMLKMLLDPLGGIVLTNDGNSILREVDVAHPGAKSIIELSRAIDEEVGDGTTSVVVLAGEFLACAEPLLQKNIHPTVIAKGYLRALEDSIRYMEEMSVKIDVNDRESLVGVIDSCLKTKFSGRWGSLISSIALKAAETVSIVSSDSPKEIDIKRYVRIEKIPGGEIEDSYVLDGVVVNKDVVHPRMKRLIINPKVLLLDCTLEYKKGESQTNVEITKEADWEALLKQEEEEVEAMCKDIIATGCNVVFTEKGVSDLAQHFLVKAGISVIRRIRKSDNNRIARVTGATIASRTEELTPEDVGTSCGRFEVKKIGDEYFCFLTESKTPRACSILLRGGSKDVLNELERNLHDALAVARNILLDPALLPGGGGTEMAISCYLNEKSFSIEDTQVWAYKAFAQALEIIPKTLAQNCGANVMKTLTQLRSQYLSPSSKGQKPTHGINGCTGAITNVTELGIWDTLAVKQQIYKTAVEATLMLLRIDDVLSSVSKKKDPVQNKIEQNPNVESFGDSRDG
ncbi:putative t-complex protein 1 gamma subunit [Cryptosporidium canis]|uniref:T-complex protein 1 subunit gamma n=1 Tax=Cryptosporidium canis TaxID=195482 RepID=A0A9D5DM73_9CRYT|nr:putative t-complex protein 1 gamma subunit [Cryptosporidium canis]